MGGARQFILTTIVLLVCHSGLRAQSHIEWVGSWAEAQALAARHQRLVLMHFWEAGLHSVHETRTFGLQST